MIVIVSKEVITLEINEFIEDIKKQVENLKICLNTVSIDLVLETMGFSKNWFEINNM